MGQKWVLTCNSARFPFLCAAGSQSMAKFPDPYPFSSRARRDKHNMQMQVRLQCSKEREERASLTLANSNNSTSNNGQQQQRQKGNALIVKANEPDTDSNIDRDTDSTTHRRGQTERHGDMADWVDLGRADWNIDNGQAVAVTNFRFWLQIKHVPKPSSRAGMGWNWCVLMPEAFAKHAKTSLFAQGFASGLTDPFGQSLSLGINHHHLSCSINANEREGEEDRDTASSPYIWFGRQFREANEIKDACFQLQSRYVFPSFDSLPFSKMTLFQVKNHKFLSPPSTQTFTLIIRGK